MKKLKLHCLPAMLLALCAITGCSHDDDSGVRPISSGKFTQNGTTVTYRINTLTLSAGESLRIEFTKEGSNPIVSVVNLDGDQTEITNYPHVWSRKMTAKGSFPLTVGAAITTDNGAIEIDSRLSASYTLTVK